MAAALLVGTSACSSDSDDTAVGSVGTDVAAIDGGDTTIEAPVDETDATGTEPTTTPGDAPDDPASSEAAAVPESLQFTAPLVGGGTFDGAAVAGMPTVFWFWAPT